MQKLQHIIDWIKLKSKDSRLPCFAAFEVSHKAGCLTKCGKEDSNGSNSSCDNHCNGWREYVVGWARYAQQHDSSGACDRVRTNALW